MLKRQWDLLSEEKKKKAIDEIISFFKNERDEEIGILAAEKILDFFLEVIGPDYYNKGVEDSREFFKKYFEDLDIDIEVLLKK